MISSFKIFTAAMTVVFFTAACTTVKMPASDNKALLSYEREIACVKSTEISAEKKYKAAEVLFEKLDFTYIRDLDSLYAVLGQGAMTASFDGDRLQYSYSYGNKSITAIFWYQGPRVIRSSVLYKDASKPSKAPPKYLPDSARGAAEDSTTSPKTLPVNPNKPSE